MIIAQSTAGGSSEKTAIRQKGSTDERRRAALCSAVLTAHLAETNTNTMIYESTQRLSNAFACFVHVLRRPLNPIKQQLISSWRRFQNDREDVKDDTNGFYSPNS